MEKVYLRENDEFIKLGQALKKADIVSSGIEAKEVITEGKVKVNGETELRRGKKLYKGDTFEVNGKKFNIDKK